MSDKGKELVSSISQIITAIQTLFFGLFLIALNSNSFYSNLLPWSLATAVVLPITGFQIFSGLRGYSRHKAELKTYTKYFLLVPNVLGFTFMGIGATLLSFYETKTMSLPKGAYYTYVIHQYSSLAGTLFFTGLGIIILTLLIYYYLIPKKLAKKPEIDPKIAAMIEDM